jgi:hypothetical protein
MSGDRPAYGSLFSALGAIVLGVAVFLPWYGLSLSAAGTQAAQQAGQQVVAQFGNAALQSQFAGISARFGQLAGHELGAVSAHDALHTISVLLLIVAGVAILLALRPLAGSSSSLPEPGAGWMVLLGLLGGCLVLYRLVSPPLADNVDLTLSPREGAWLALLGAAAMIGGGLWPQRVKRATPSDDELKKAWSSLSGWTPGA